MLRHATRSETEYQKVSLVGDTDWRDCLNAIGSLARVQGLVHGPAIAEFERAFADRVGARHGISFIAGRVGLHGLLGALGVGADDEVLLQVPTHVVVANAIRYLGARPVYVDCEPRTFNIDLADAERRVTARSRVLLVQHTFGVPADLDAALDLAARHGLTLVEDCVHSLGATFRGRQIGTFGRAAFFSMEETKTISTTVGGMVITDDEDLARQLRTFQSSCDWPAATMVARYLAKLVAYQLLTQPLIHRFSRWVYESTGKHHPLPRPSTAEEHLGLRPAGYATRLSNAQARLGLRQLARLDENLAHRRAITAVYHDALQHLGGPDLNDPRCEPALVRYPVRVPDRDAVIEALDHLTVVGTWFSSVLEEAKDPEALGYTPGSCPIAEVLVDHLVNLPTHPRVREDHARNVVRALTTVLHDGGEAG